MLEIGLTVLKRVGDAGVEIKIRVSCLSPGMTQPALLHTYHLDADSPPSWRFSRLLDDRIPLATKGE